MHKIRKTSCRVASSCPPTSSVNISASSAQIFRGIAFHRAELGLCCAGRGNAIKLFAQRSAIVSKDTRQGHQPKWPGDEDYGHATSCALKPIYKCPASADICELSEKWQLSLSNSIVESFTRFVLCRRAAGMVRGLEKKLKMSQRRQSELE